jgi:hypothetical protein
MFIVAPLATTSRNLRETSWNCRAARNLHLNMVNLYFAIGNAHYVVLCLRIDTNIHIYIIHNIYK